MQQHMICRLSILLLAHIFLAAVLAAPRSNQVVNIETDLIVGANFEEPASWSSSSDVAIMGVVAAEPGMDTVIIAPTMVTVSVTTIKTTIVDPVTIVPDVINSSGVVIPEALTDDQPETLAITYAAEHGTNAQASNIVMTHMIADHASSTSQSLRHTNYTTTTTFKTITSMASSSSSTSSFDLDFCDEIFCNTDGNKVCIYWAGFTSWDVSLGPIPGERPTVIGSC